MVRLVNLFQAGLILKPFYLRACAICFTPPPPHFYPHLPSSFSSLLCVLWFILFYQIYQHYQRMDHPLLPPHRVTLKLLRALQAKIPAPGAHMVVPCVPLLQRRWACGVTRATCARCIPTRPTTPGTNAYSLAGSRRHGGQGGRTNGFFACARLPGQALTSSRRCGGVNNSGGCCHSAWAASSLPSRAFSPFYPPPPLPFY